jgi:hypothetical protein
MSDAFIKDQCCHDPLVANRRKNKQGDESKATGFPHPEERELPGKCDKYPKFFLSLKLLAVAPQFKQAFATGHVKKTAPGWFWAT